MQKSRTRAAKLQQSLRRRRSSDGCWRAMFRMASTLLVVAPRTTPRRERRAVLCRTFPGTAAPVTNASVVSKASGSSGRKSKQLPDASCSMTTCSGKKEGPPTKGSKQAIKRELSAAGEVATAAGGACSGNCSKACTKARIIMAISASLSACTMRRAKKIPNASSASRVGPTWVDYSQVLSRSTFMSVFASRRLWCSKRPLS